MLINLVMFGKVVSHEHARTLRQMEAGLRVPTRAGTVSNGHNQVDLKFMQASLMISSSVGMFALQI